MLVLVVVVVLVVLVLVVVVVEVVFPQQSCARYPAIVAAFVMRLIPGGQVTLVQAFGWQR